jgi:hypothetical protein
MRVVKRAGLSFRLVRVLAAAAAVAALPGFLSSCSSSSGAASAAGNGSSNVIALNNIDTLKTLFNRDDGDTRLILIFSPT